MIWTSFDAGFTSVAENGNGDNVVLKILDYVQVDIETTEWQPNWKTLNNRNYVRGFYDRAEKDLVNLPYGPEPEDIGFGSDFVQGRSFSMGRGPREIAGPVSAQSQVNIGGATTGVYPVGRRDNLIRGSDLATAVVGSPGTLPGDMFTNGIASRTVDAIGVQNGINYVDVTLNVAAGTTANIYLFANGSNTLFKSSADGSPSIAMDFTWFLGMRPGTTGNYNPLITMRTGEHTNAAFATGSYTSQVSGTISIPNDGIIRPFSTSGLVPTDPSTKPCILAGLLFTKLIGTATASIPLRIGWPCLDSTAWYHPRRRGMAYIIPLTAKADTVFRAHRMLQPILPQTPQFINSLAAKKFSFVFDCDMDLLNTPDSYSATIMPLVRLFNNNASQNILTLCIQTDNTLQGMKPLWFNVLTSSYIAGADGVLIPPGKRFRIAASLDNNGLRWSVNGGTVNTYSDGSNTGIAQYYVNNMMLDGTGYLFKRLDVLYRTLTGPELQALSR